MPCSKSVTLGAEQLTIYWGGVDAGNYPAYLMDLEDDPGFFDPLIALLNAEVGPYRANGIYYMDLREAINPLNGAFFYFVVPDSYADIVSLTGFKFGLGNVIVPITNCLTQLNQPDYYGQIPGGLSNWPSPFTFTNGWCYFLHDIAGVPYRWYAFGMHPNNLISNLVGPIGISPLSTRERTANVAKITAANPIIISYTPFAGAISGSTDATFDDPTAVVSQTTLTTYTYANTGPNVAPTADATMALDEWDRLNIAWFDSVTIDGSHPTASTVTLFVTHV